MEFDSFSVFFLEDSNKIVPCVLELLWFWNILFIETIAVAKLDNLLYTDIIITTTEDLMNIVAHECIFLLLSAD